MSTVTSESDLLVDRLEIRGFRRFEHLDIKRLARVNLIVGRNGVGKTSLLEAIRILATIGNPNALLEILSSRDEQGQNPSAGRDLPNPLEFVALFRRVFNLQPKPILRLGVCLRE